MDALLNMLQVTFEEGFAYAVLALGVYISYSILDFPDLSVDGTVPLGGVISAILILQGINPWLSCLIAFLAGAAAGAVTGILNVKLKIRPLLCGILVMTALLSINFALIMAGTGGKTIASLFQMPTFSNSFPVSVVPKSIKGFHLRTLIVVTVIAIICKYLLDLYLKTKSGLLLRAAGNNPQYVTMLARNPGTMKILGLALGNGFAAFAGSIITQQKGSADLQMGTGMVVIGLASVIIGLSLFGKIRFLRATTSVMLGAIFYKACLQLALALGVPTEYFKLLTAVLLTLFIVFSQKLSKKEAPAYD